MAREIPDLGMDARDQTCSPRRYKSCVCAPQGRPEPAVPRGDQGKWQSHILQSRPSIAESLIWTLAAPRTSPTIPLPRFPPPIFDQPSWLHTANAVGMEELAGTQPDWLLQYDQLSKGRFVGSLQHVRLPGVRLVVESVSRAVRQRGQIGPNDVGFALGLSPSGASYFHGQRLDGAFRRCGKAVRSIFLIDKLINAFMSSLM